MNWTVHAGLHAQALRLWERGDLLRACVSDAIAWPLRLSLKLPSAADLSERFDAVRGWANELTSTPHVRIEYRDIRHRVQGTQRLPCAAWVDTLDDALQIIGKSHDAQRFRMQWSQTAKALPALLLWLTKRPLQGLELAECWMKLLAVVQWMIKHPHPNVYLRQVDVPGVDSKFIEANKGVLIELLDLALPAETIDANASGTSQFNRRYGFREKPARLRFRLLDASLPLLPGSQGLCDVTLDIASFSSLSLPVERAFITENETNFLAFPAVERSIVIFGAGYGWEALSHISWLHRCALFYWGDIDTHGLAILDQLRAHFPQTISFLMDQRTLLEHEPHWGMEPQPIRHNLHRLTLEESELYDDLRTNRLNTHLRLEQERIAYSWLLEHLPGNSPRHPHSADTLSIKF